jgi:hypothetical protein
MKVNVFFLFIVLTCFMSCSKKKVEPELKYTAEEVSHILSDVKLAADKNPKAINYSDYAPGVNHTSAQALLYERLGFIAVEFETEKQARDEAFRLNQYYSRNWLFDKVEGEPLLEDLVLIKFHAQNPKRRTQRKAVNAPIHGHGAEAGGGEHH